jgi:hypothetical protein
VNVADACKAPGYVGALLRREAIFSSLMTTWRKHCGIAQRLKLESLKRETKVNPSLDQVREVAQFTRDNERLRRQIAQAHAIIVIQKMSRRC